MGVLGALAGIIAAEIVTGGAITAALPIIINVITTAMNAAMVVSIIDTIAKAAGYIETYLTQGWARHIQPAAIALATALAMGLVELAMALGFKFAEKGIKAAKGGIKKGIKATAGGAKKLVTTAGKGIKSLLKSGAKLVSKTGSMIIENGKIIIKSLKNGFSKGAKKLQGLIDKILSKFRFKKFKIERKGLHIRIYGEVNPWVLLYDGTIKEIDAKNTHAGDIIEHEGKRGVVITRNTKPTAKVNDLNALSQGERKAIYENALKNGGKVEVKGVKVTTQIISDADKLKLSKWTKPPKEELYLKYKNIYDNPKYFNQETGYPYHPGTENPVLGNVDKNIDGFLNGEFTPNHTLSEGTFIDRYGDNSGGQYFSPMGESYESRALAPYMDTATYTRYKVIKPFNVKSGVIAPWWGRKGMGTQFFTDYKILAKDGTYVKATVDNLLQNDYIAKLAN